VLVRTQIRLTQEQVRQLRQRASERGVSSAKLIREAVDRSLAEDEAAPRRRRMIESIGGFRSGLVDVGRNHDAYLSEDFD
jgi:hypothetical protein